MAFSADRIFSVPVPRTLADPSQSGVSGTRSCRASWFEPRNVQPLLLLPALQAELGELYAFRGLEQVPAELAFAGHVLEEQLPLRLEGVIVILVGHFLPAL